MRVRLAWPTRFFSLETLATVSYGEMYPADLYGHVISSAEILIGMAFIAIATGLIFVCVSRPRPCFEFADWLAITSEFGRGRIDDPGRRRCVRRAA